MSETTLEFITLEIITTYRNLCRLHLSGSAVHVHHMHHVVQFVRYTLLF